MAEDKINSYNLSREWFNFCFENPEKISPNHTALYFFAIEQCNRLGWKEKFGLPSTMAKEAIGIRSYNTYIKALHDLVDFGFIKMIEVSKNQYSSNIIALSIFDKAPIKALDKAIIKHTSKQDESTYQSISSIDKQETSNNKQLNKEQSFYQIKNELLESVINKQDITPFTDESLKPYWHEWKMFRVEKQNPLTPSSEKKALKVLFEESGGNVDLAIKAINKAIASGHLSLNPKPEPTYKQKEEQPKKSKLEGLYDLHQETNRIRAEIYAKKNQDNDEFNNF